MSGIKWEEPDKKPRKWVALLNEVRSRPGQWALIEERANGGIASLIRTGRLGGAVKGEFEAVTRSNGDGTYRVYVRYEVVSE